MLTNLLKFMKQEANLLNFMKQEETKEKKMENSNMPSISMFEQKCHITIFPSPSKIEKNQFKVTPSPADCFKF